MNNSSRGNEMYDMIPKGPARVRGASQLILFLCGLLCLCEIDDLLSTVD